MEVKNVIKKLVESIDTDMEVIIEDSDGRQSFVYDISVDIDNFSKQKAIVLKVN